jgi:hypothetical protein
MAKKNARTEPRYRTAATGWVTKAEIEALLTSGVQTEAVTHLRRQDIEVAEEGVFQFRDHRENPAGKRRHIAVLVRALNNTAGKPLDPLLVFPAGGRYFVMQGHHRLAAYDAAGWNEPIPVEVFQGGLAEARAAALEDGGKDKLPMSRTEKSNAAWRLVAEGQHSIERTADLGQVSPSTVKTMRTKLREITAAGKDPLEMDWEQARRWPRDSYGPDGGEWLSKKVEQLAQRIKETGLANEISKHPELFVEALASIDPEWPSIIAEHVETETLEEIIEARQEDAKLSLPLSPAEVAKMHTF